MGSTHKSVTPAVLAANRANSAASTGPATDTGKEQSKMNAFKNGKYARRPDPVELLRNDHWEEEEAERDQLRAEVVRCYQPPDGFACRQAEELADLQFELHCLERAKEVMLARERELLALEQRRRALRLKEESAQARVKEINQCGLVSQPDSPGKFREVLRVLELLVGQNHGSDDVRIFLRRLYGDSERAWRGIRLTWAVDRVDKAESGESSERANRDFEREVKQEIEQVREELAICELEQGPLSPAGEAAWLLEAMGSRKWSWIRHQETFLRRSIDRKARVLIELRRDANRPERRVGGRAGADSASGQGGGGDGSDGPAGGSPLAAADSATEPDDEGSDNGVQENQTIPETAGSEPRGSSVAVEPAPAPVVRLQGDALQVEKRAQNQGTKPLSPLVSAEAWQQVQARFAGWNAWASDWSSILLLGLASGSKCGPPGCGRTAADGFLPPDVTSNGERMGGRG